MSTIGEHIEKDRDGLTGEVVSETERRTVGNQVGLVLIKGKVRPVLGSDVFRAIPPDGVHCFSRTS